MVQTDLCHDDVLMWLNCILLSKPETNRSWIIGDFQQRNRNQIVSKESSKLGEIIQLVQFFKVLDLVDFYRTFLIEPSSILITYSKLFRKL